MPMNLEYVLAAYLICIGIFVLYVPLLKRKYSQLKKTMMQISKQKKDSSS